MKKIAVTVTGLTADEEKQFIEFLQERDLKWWHWIGDLWIVQSLDDNKKSLQEIRTFLRERRNSERGFICTISDDSSWVGFAERDKLDEIFDWVKKNWRK